MASEKEARYYHTSGRALAAKKQLGLAAPLLGNATVIVLHANYALDLTRIYEAGVRTGNGTDDERQCMREVVDASNSSEEHMQREILKLLTN